MSNVKPFDPKRVPESTVLQELKRDEELRLIQIPYNSMFDRLIPYVPTDTSPNS